MEDLKTAMRSHDETRRSVIRLMRAAVQNEEINKGKALDDAGVVEVLSRMARQYRESIDIYRQAARKDLLDKEEGELAVLAQYLPQQLTRAEVADLAKQAVQQVGARGPGDKGKVMGKLMPQLRGKADGNMVNTVVTELLESLGSQASPPRA
jgi:uncharacterized protein YqeY